MSSAACAPPALDAGAPESPAAGINAGPPTLILISLDGFRWDYPDLYDTPNLRRLAAEGVRAEGLVPVFPTKTFPNHYTVVTGLYPEHHGIIANNMFDPAWEARFSLGDRPAIEDARWWEGEPLWVTAEKQGRTSATFFWPGSEAAIGGIRPSFWKRYDDDVPGPARVRQVLEWLDLPPDQRPGFITLYFSEVDHAGHDYGPETDETAAAVERVDAHIGMLIEGLEERDLLEDVNIVIVSDHGMAATSPDRVIALDDYIDLDDVRVVDWSPVAMLRPEPGKEAEVYRALKGAHPHLSVYRRDDLPERFHFRAHRRIPPIIAVADEGWSITSRERAGERERFEGGTHGYDNRLRSMRGILIARGPAFEQGKTIAPVENVDLYNMMAAVLGLDPAPNDGDDDAIRLMLRRPQRVGR